MGRKLFTNNALTTLASSISAVANSCSATSGGGSLFPAITSGSGNSFQMTFLKIVSGAVTAQEIVTVTARTGDVLSITRAQESTTALAWNAGDTIAKLPTAGDMTSFMQAGDIQAQTGNYAQDTGVANAYVAAVTPALTAHSLGTPIVWKASNTNTGASTFNDGFGTANLLAPDLLPLAAGMIEAGGIYESVWDGTQFQVLSPWVLTIAEAFATAAANSAQSAAEAFTTAAINSLGTSTTSNITATSSTTFGTAMTLTLPVGIFKLSALLAFFQASAGNAGVAFQVIGGTATVSFVNLFGATTGTVNGAAKNGFSSNVISYIAVSPTNATDFIIWDCNVHVTVAGTLLLQFAQNVSSAITSTLAQGSSLVATKIG